MTVVFTPHKVARLFSRMGNDLQFESVNPKDNEEAKEFNTFQEALAHEWETEIEEDDEGCPKCGEDDQECLCLLYDEEGDEI
jgi:hypothetical protein